MKLLKNLLLSSNTKETFLSKKATSTTAYPDRHYSFNEVFKPRIRMIELNVVNKEADMLHIAYGISEERSNEIGDKLDEIMERYKDKTIMYHDLINDIKSICETNEEFVFALITNTRYLTLKNIVYARGKRNS